MKSSLLRTFFEWALITSVLMSVGFLTWYCFKSRAMRAQTARLGSAEIELQRNRTVMGMLMTECQTYAKTNADMAKLLATGVVPAAAPAPATTKPGAK
jgi:hypothetical protein